MSAANAKNNKVQPPSGARLWLLLWKATKAMEAHARCSVEATGMCLSDFGVLETLLHKGPLPVSALGKKVLLTSGSMTVAVDRLESGGLVRRKASATDRRSRIVHLTASGTRLIRKIFEKHKRDLHDAFACLDEAEKKALAGILQKLDRRTASLDAVAAETAGDE